MDKKASVFIIMGVSGCGKSTIGRLLADTFKIPFFDGDDYHPEVNVKKMASGNPLNDADRAGWLRRLNDLAIEFKATGVVIACSALKESYRKILRENLKNEIEFVFLQGTFEEISHRLNQRKNHFMPSGLLESQFDALEIPKDAISVSITKTPSQIITDILMLRKQKNPD